MLVKIREKWEGTPKKNLLFSGAITNSFTLSAVPGCLIVRKLLSYSPFHKTFPKSGLQMLWTSVRFYEMGVIYHQKKCRIPGDQIKIILLHIFSMLPLFFLSKIKLGGEGGR